MLEHLARVAAELRAPLLQDRPYLALRAAVGSGRAVGEKPENRVVGMLKLIYQSEYPTSQRYRLKVGIEGDPVGLFGGRAGAPSTRISRRACVQTNSSPVPPASG